MSTKINLTGINALNITGIDDASVSQGVTSFTITPTPPVGLTGDIQFNNGGVFDGSAATVNAAGTLSIPVGQVIEFEGYGYSTAGLSWLAADTLAVGDGSEGDVSGGMAMTALILFGSGAYDPYYESAHTSVYSGASEDWTLVLPANAGIAGQTPHTDGTGKTYWA